MRTPYDNRRTTTKRLAAAKRRLGGNRKTACLSAWLPNIQGERSGGGQGKKDKQERETKISERKTLKRELRMTTGTTTKAAAAMTTSKEAS